MINKIKTYIKHKKHSIKMMFKLMRNAWKLNSIIAWYEQHQTLPQKIRDINDNIYDIDSKCDDNYYKIQFISYYNADDEERHVSFLIGALENSTFPALSNPILVSPSKCTILESMAKSDFWEETETIMIYENDFDICYETCSIKIFITYENISVKGTKIVILV